ncbi:hypothetical protein [Chitinimonas lacunae]|uniref:Uncharacterized protein n=1 Tax=Chitinimonas lacunae TaxID=1963018 RepID=A0ABV8MLB4_9NEIS
MPTYESQHAETSLAAYLNLLKTKGAATSLINQRKHILRHLLSALEAQAGRFIDDDDAGYRRAVDQIQNNFPNEQQIEIISAAREFHPFWLGDLKTIARLNSAEALTLDPVPLDISGSLIDMFERMDRHPWSQQEPECLQHYLVELSARGADDAVIDLRERLLKLLLFVIRDAMPMPTAYRAGVDAMLTLFSKEDTRRAFIDVAREFFYYWNGFHSQTPLDRAPSA